MSDRERRRTGSASWPLRIGAVALWSVLQAVFLLPRSLDGLVTPGAYRPLFPPVAGALVNLGIAWAFVWWFARRPVASGWWRRAATYRLRPVPLGAIPWLAAAAIALVFAVNASLLVLPRLLGVPRTPSTFLDAYLRLPFGAVAVFVLVAAIAPLLEEFFFRGWMQHTLERRTAPWAAIAITALTFAAVHLDLFGFPLRLGFAVASGYAAWRTRSIWPSVVLHGAYNGSLIVVSGLLPNVDERKLALWSHDDRVFWPSVLIVVIAAVALAAALRALAGAMRGYRAEGADRVYEDAVAT